MWVCWKCECENTLTLTLTLTPYLFDPSMMKIIFSAIAFLTITSSFGQILFPEKQSTCEAKSMVFENDAVLIGYQSDEALLFDFLKKIETRYLKKMKGELFVQILIDPIGHPCCLSFENKTDVQTKRLGVANAVQSMDGWKIPNSSNSGGKPVCVIVKFIFTNRKFVAVRMGYSTKSRYIELSSVQVKRSAIKD